MNAHTASTQELWLVRHGETEWSRAGRHTSTTDLPLTEHGVEVARDLAPRLEEVDFDQVLTSPRQRARTTAELVGRPGAEVDEDLVEWAYGDYEGVTTEEIRETVPGWTVWTHPCPHGETADDVARRADSVLADARAADTDVVLVGHGHFSRVLVSRWLARPATDGVHFAMDAAGWAVLGDERGVPRIDGLNYRPLA
jgi:broad specificity phosphatase PhoE